MLEDTLLPCPFCGRDDQLTFVWLPSGVSSSVMSTPYVTFFAARPPLYLVLRVVCDCGCEGPIFSKQEDSSTNTEPYARGARDKWNNRTRIEEEVWKI